MRMRQARSDVEDDVEETSYVAREESNTIATAMKFSLPTT